MGPAASALAGLHRRYVYGRRVTVLADMVAQLLPPAATVLDVGCGDGRIDSLVLRARPDVTIEGLDVLLRPNALVPVRLYDGTRLPYADRGVDAVTFVDVLHHTDDPASLLADAARVARHAVIVKDHLAEGVGARLTLQFMDRVGNQAHGVRLPYNYWRREQWTAAIAGAGLCVHSWTTRVPLYPWWASWLFGRSLHFVAALSPR